VPICREIVSIVSRYAPGRGPIIIAPSAHGCSALTKNAPPHHRWAHTAHILPFVAVCIKQRWKKAVEASAHALGTPDRLSLPQPTRPASATPPILKILSCVISKVFAQGKSACLRSSAVSLLARARCYPTPSTEVPDSSWLFLACTPGAAVHTFIPVV
jgi:hypothetical protein